MNKEKNLMSSVNYEEIEYRILKNEMNYKKYNVMGKKYLKDTKNKFFSNSKPLSGRRAAVLATRAKNGI